MSPNSHDMLDDMAFNRELEEMGDDLPKLVKFMAWRQFEMTKQLETVTQLCPVHGKRIRALENRTKKEIGATGGVSALIGAGIAAAVDYFVRRGS